MANKDKQLTAVKSKIRKPEITLNEKVFDGIKGLGIDDELTLTMKVKVIGTDREPDFDIPMDSDMMKRPKILRARFEVQDVKKK